MAGTYVLSESGPAGYLASQWSCTGGTQSGNSITLGVGDVAVCQIHNSGTVKSVVTDSSLCTFDRDSGTAGNQFNLLFTPDASNGWKLNASNPGQFYYNVIYFGDGNGTIKLKIPYPFVTQGAVPIHVYKYVTIEDQPGGGTCFVPGEEVGHSSTQVTLADYTDTNGDGKVGGFGDFIWIEVNLPHLDGGQAYINIHLDYGLKGTTGYAKGNGGAVSYTSPGTLLIPDGQAYKFDDDVLTATPGETRGGYHCVQ